MALNEKRLVGVKSGQLKARRKMLLVIESKKRKESPSMCQRILQGQSSPLIKSVIDKA